jgi:hypothetical protein
MNDGYYLAAYLTPPGISRLIGVWVRHDSNVSLWKKSDNKIELLAHWELERLTGVKHEGTAALSGDHAGRLITGLIGTFGLTMDDLERIWGTPGLPGGESSAAGQPVDPVLARHAMAHLFTGLLMDSARFYRESIVALAIDGGPDTVLEKGSTRHLFAGGAVIRGKLSVFPVESPGPLFDHAKIRFGMPEGSLMALAPASSARCDFDIEGALRDGYYGDAGVHSLAGQVIDRICAAATATLTGEDPAFTPSENYISAAMKVVQELSYRIVERNVRRILDDFSISPEDAWLSMTGGYALNCPTNSRLIEQFGFRGLLSPPYVNDGGQSIGIALEQFYAGFEGEELEHVFPGPYLGTRDESLDDALSGCAEYVESVSSFAAAVAARDVAAGPVAWFNGAAESGPRALGHRSILADPRTASSRDGLNEIKQREWWRPVAPAVLSEHAGDWFVNARHSPYMLETFQLRPGCEARVPAIAHLDNSARIQSVDSASNPLLARVITEFFGMSGIPMVCNTSLNDKGEAIIDTIPQAINFCLRKKISCAYFNGTRVVFKNFDAYPEKGPTPRPAPWLCTNDEEIIKARARLNPAALEDVYLFIYVYNPALFSNFDPSSVRSAQALRRVIDGLFGRNPEMRAMAVEIMEQERRVYGESRPFVGAAMAGFGIG